jgi:hypothetical protein
MSETNFWDGQQGARACRVLARLAGAHDEAELWTLEGPTDRARGFALKGAGEENAATRIALSTCAFLLDGSDSGLNLADLFDLDLDLAFLEGLFTLLLANRGGPRSIECWLRNQGDTDAQTIDGPGTEREHVIDYDRGYDGRFPNCVRAARSLRRVATI